MQTKYELELHTTITHSMGHWPSYKSIWNRLLSCRPADLSAFRLLYLWYKSYCRISVIRCRRWCRALQIESVFISLDICLIGFKVFLVSYAVVKVWWYISQKRVTPFLTFINISFSLLCWAKFLSFDYSCPFVGCYGLSATYCSSPCVFIILNNRYTQLCPPIGRGYIFVAKQRTVDIHANASRHVL